MKGAVINGPFAAGQWGGVGKGIVCGPVVGFPAFCVPWSETSISTFQVLLMWGGDAGLTRGVRGFLFSFPKTGYSLIKKPIRLASGKINPPKCRPWQEQTTLADIKSSISPPPTKARGFSLQYLLWNPPGDIGNKPTTYRVPDCMSWGFRPPYSPGAASIFQL